MPFSELLAGYGTTSLGDGMQVESVMTLLKLRSDTGKPAWSVRSGGVTLSQEELLGVLEGLIVSMRQKLAGAWKRQDPPPNPGNRPPPMQFSELLDGLETMGIGDEYLIESVLAVIKARRPDGALVWNVRSSEMTLSSEERLGAIEGYAATVREGIAAKWRW